MFDIGWSELLVIAVVAIVVIGPKDLPRVLRSVGRWTGQAKRMARDFQNQFNEALREAELDSVKKDIEDLGKIDPLGEVRTEMAKTNAEIMTELKVMHQTLTQLPADASAQYADQIDATRSAAGSLRTSLEAAGQSPSASTLETVHADLVALGNTVQKLGDAVAGTC